MLRTRCSLLVRKVSVVLLSKLIQELILSFRRKQQLSHVDVTAERNLILTRMTPAYGPL